jgi:hypothetical protein
MVRFFVTYGLVRNKNRLCKGWDNRIVQKQKQKKTHTNKKVKISYLIYITTSIYNITKRKLVLKFLFNTFIVK